MNNQSHFFLKNYSNKDHIEFEFNKQNIRIELNLDKLEKYEELKSNIKNYSDTAILTISNLKEKGKSVELANDIKVLLSIAIGKRIIFDKYIFSFDNTEEVIEKGMSKNGNTGPQIVPNFEVKYYLEKSLPVWTKFTELQKREIFIIADYLNQTRNDFIEDRLLRVVQAWECASHYWIDKIELSEDLIVLRQKIKKIYRNWKADNGYIDTNGELGKRLTNSLDQEKLALKLEKLIKETGLIPKEINLDLRELKNLRDLVVHTGKINMTGEDAIKLLEPGVKGLQLILLKKLGYDGLVYDSKNNWETMEKLTLYFE